MLVLRRPPTTPATPPLRITPAQLHRLQCGGTRVARHPFVLGGRALRVDVIHDEKQGTLVLRVRRADGAICSEVKGRPEYADDNAFLAIALDLLEEGDPAAALGRLADLLGEECAA